MLNTTVPTVVILMGVSGSGKTTIGEKVAAATGGEFFDGDDFHPEANVKKMHAGIPLDDTDRLPWLQRLRSLIEQQAQKNTPTFLACSALKRTYRRLLDPNDSRVAFVYLQGSFSLISERLHARQGHFMPESLLRSQFDALEQPDDCLSVDIDQSPDAIVNELRQKLGL